MTAHSADFATKAMARQALPDWPRLMGVELAADYLGIGRTMLEEVGPEARRVGRRKLYDRRDLDRWADQLDGQPLEGEDAAAAAREVERNFLEGRKGKDARR